MQRLDRSAAALLLAALVPLLLWDWSGLDIVVARWFGTAQGFDWRDDFWLSTLGHIGARNLAWVLALALALMVNIWRPWTPRLTRRERVWWLLATLAAIAVVPLIKQQSLTSCPWDLSEFGGAAQQISHWLQQGPGGLRDGGGGRCFPSGHATSAFAFFSGALALRRAYPVAARHWMAGVLFTGLVLGLIQLARGAHFPSHTLWSAWVCLAVHVLLMPWMSAQRTARQSVMPT